MMKLSPADFVSLGNAFCGALAVFFFIDGYISIGCMLLIMCMVLDGLDGMVARRFISDHKYGTHIDSAADAISFCIAPGVLVWCVYANVAGLLSQLLLWAAISFAIVFGIFRLIGFVRDGHKRNNFTGLPTPANCLFIVSICYFHANYIAGHISGIIGEMVGVITNPAAALLLIALVSMLMVSHFEYLKFRGVYANIVGFVLLFCIAGMILTINHMNSSFMPQLLALLSVWIYVFYYPLRKIGADGRI